LFFAVDEIVKPPWPLKLAIRQMQHNEYLLLGGKMLILPWWSLKLARTIDATPEKKREACTAAVNITTHID